MTLPDKPDVDLVERFFSGTGSSYDFMVNAATFGIDRLWKRRIIALLQDRPKRILDLACGTGILTIRLARRFPDSRIVGVELRDEYLRIARARVRRLKLDNVEFVLSRAEDYRCEELYDCVVSSYLAKYAELPVLTRNTRELLRPGGLVLMHDFTYPPTPLLIAVWRLYFVALRTIGSAFYPAWQTIFNELPRLIEHSHWCTEFWRCLQEAGFRDLCRVDLTLYGSALITARR